MKKTIIYAIALITAFTIFGCVSSKLSPETQAIVNNKGIVYTQICMWTENSHIIATNYATGELIAINSPVTIEDITSKTITFNWEGESIVLKNVKKYTKLNIDGLFRRTFKNTKVDLSRFNKNITNNIKKGIVKTEMSKDEVILARGYPPAHRTASLEKNNWRYWSNRFHQSIYTFKNDLLTKIKQF
ncbi:MAG: hypothetical protein GY710_09665 [Desulfobacteraceae bacterium]|nr:hypothetical protein [Desulfobacteraceae bacterium]